MTMGISYFSDLHTLSCPQRHTAVFRVNFHILVCACVSGGASPACDALSFACCHIKNSSRIAACAQTNERASERRPLVLSERARAWVCACPPARVCCHTWMRKTPRRAQPAQPATSPAAVTWGRGGGKRRSSWNEPRPGPCRRLIGPRSESRVAVVPVIDRRRRWWSAKLRTPCPPWWGGWCRTATITTSTITTTTTSPVEEAEAADSRAELTAYRLASPTAGRISWSSPRSSCSTLPSTRRGRWSRWREAAGSTGGRDTQSEWRHCSLTNKYTFPNMHIRVKYTRRCECWALWCCSGWMHGTAADDCWPINPPAPFLFALCTV